MILTEVTQDTATVKWMAPKSTANVTHYIVSYVEHSHADEMAPTKVCFMFLSKKISVLKSNIKIITSHASSLMGSGDTFC